MYLRGQTVSPAFACWWPNDDGTYTLYFGYFNTNWEGTYEIPVGPDNYFTLAEAGGADELEQGFYDAGEADQGQPGPQRHDAAGAAQSTATGHVQPPDPRGQ